MKRTSTPVLSLLLSVLVAAAVAAGVASARGAGTGQLLFGSCVSEDGTGGDCTDGKALDGAFGAAVSPDGRHVYAASLNSDAVSVFVRNTSTGALTQLAGTAGCISNTGSGGDCVDGTALFDANAVAVSPDGKNVYAVSSQSHAIAVFARDAATGALAQLAGNDGCIDEFGAVCADGKALGSAIDVAVSPDGKHVYVASYTSDAVAVFARNASTGTLTQLAGTAGCVSEDSTTGACADGKALDGPLGIAISPDGKQVYVASNTSNAVVVFSRAKKTGALTQLAGTAGCVSDTGSGGDCADGRALDGARAAAVSPDGKQVYVASEWSDSVTVFSRAKKSGALTQLPGTAGCVSDTGSGGDCVDGKEFNQPYDIVVSPDGTNVYVSSITSDAVDALARSKSTGALTQLADAAGCIGDIVGEGCVDATALDGPAGLAVSADRKHVYVASFSSDAVVALTRS